VTPEERYAAIVEAAQSAFMALNRTGRRARGFRGPKFEKGGGRSYFVPRYIRRHYDADSFRFGNTRRQRKVRARVTRLVAQKGLGVTL
jgi:hypothetical protein